MQMEVIFNYRAHVLRPRKRKADTNVVLRDRIVVTIPEFTGADVPVAARFDDSRMEATRPLDVRWRDGVFYRPMEGYDSDNRVGDHKTVAALRAFCQDPYSPESLARSVGDRYGGESVFFENDPLGGKIESSERDNEARGAMEAASKLIVVDGTIWKTTPEPLIEISSNSFRDTYSIWTSVRTDGAGKARLSSLYRLDELDQVAAQLEKIRNRVATMPEEHRRARDYEVCDMPFVETLLPDAFVYPISENELYAGGKDVLPRMENLIAEGGRDFFDAYATLRDFLKANPAPEARLTLPSHPDRVAAYVSAVNAGIAALHANGCDLAFESWSSALERYEKTAALTEAEALNFTP